MPKPTLDIVSLSLIGIALWTAFQIVPLPGEVVRAISPERFEWHQTFLPDANEVSIFTGEEPSRPRPDWLTLSVAPQASRDFLSQLLPVLFVYLVCRSWLGSQGGLRRLAWWLTIVGIALTALAIAQFFTSRNDTIFWQFRLDRAEVFGPFVCRNHFPDYVNFSIGLAVGLLLSARSDRENGNGEFTPADRPTLPDQFFSFSRFFTQPRTLCLLAAIALMLASIPLSLSRGGMISTVLAACLALGLARIARPSRGSYAWLLIIVLAGLGLCLIAWFGWANVEKRLMTFRTGTALESRLTLWQDAWGIVPQFWTTGTGAGSFRWAEMTVRTSSPPEIDHDSAHNEYLEALIEGGVPRLAFTLLLVGGLLFSVARGAIHRANDRDFPLIIGAWFGLAALAVHCFADFGIRIPAVALLAAAIAGYTMAEIYGPRKRRRTQHERRRRSRHHSGQEKPTPSPDQSTQISRTPPPSLPPPVPSSWDKLQIVFVAWLFALLLVVIALDFRTRHIAESLRQAANQVARDGGSPQERESLLGLRVRMRPKDPDALIDYAMSRMAVVDGRQLSLAAVLGGATSAHFDPQSVIIFNDALQLTQRARIACPIHPKPHHLLAIHASQFIGEPANIHFQRACKLAPVDPYIWFRAGEYAFHEGNFDEAMEHWQKSLARSPQYTRQIVSLAVERLEPEKILDGIIPDEPLALLAAVDLLYPKQASRFESPRELVLQRITRHEYSDHTSENAVAIAKAAEELGNSLLALAAWRHAVETARQPNQTLDEFARFLERDERYAEAVEQLQLLLRASGNSSTIRERLEAARHGQALQRELGIEPAPGD